MKQTDIPRMTAWSGHLVTYRIGNRTALATG